MTDGPIARAALAIARAALPLAGGGAVTIGESPSTTAGFSIGNAAAAELITNAADRDFSGAGNWTGTNWAVNSGVLQHTTGATAAATLPSSAMTAGSILQGRYYRVQLTISNWTAGSITIALGSPASVARSTNVTIVAVVSANADNANLLVTPTTDFDGAIDNVSVQRVQASFRMQNNGLATFGFPVGTPAGSLVVSNTSGALPTIDVINDNSINMAAVRQTSYAAGALAQSILTLRVARGYPAAPAAIQSGDYLFNYLIQGHTGSSFATGPSLTFQASETWTSTARGSTFLLAHTLTGTLASDVILNCNGSGNIAMGGTGTPASTTTRLTILGGSLNKAAYTVATLPAAPATGDEARVTNALSPVFGSTVVGGGTVNVPVFFNGTNWIVG